MRLPVTAASLAEKAAGTKRLSSVLRVHHRRWYSKRNLLELRERAGFVHDIFPPHSHQKFIEHLTAEPRCVYAGFDPTADSLHVGNLMVIMALLRAQRAGHQPIGLVGGATAKIGDPSGKSSERDPLSDDFIDANVAGLKRDLETIFQNHQELFWTFDQEPKPLKIVNNMDWYGSMNLIEFLRVHGRQFRMNKLLSRDSVKSRLAVSGADPKGGLSFTEFTYQVFQAYDWNHLYNQYGCTVQIGAVDQMGNIATGHEYTTRWESRNSGRNVRRKENPTFGLMLPLITSKGGKKIGKSETGDAIWLSPNKTSPFDFYQYFLRCEDADLSKLLNFFTFLPTGQIADLISSSDMSKRLPHKKLAEEVTLLVHGRRGLELAEKTTSVLYETENIGQTLANLSKADLKEIFSQAPHFKFFSSSQTSVLDLAIKLACFKNEKAAIDAISQGGFYINQVRATNIEEILVPGKHILPNNVTLVRVGKKRYFLVEWDDF